MKKISLLMMLVCLTAGFARAQKTSSDSLYGKWVFVSSSEKDLGEIPESNLPSLVFNREGKSVSGSTGCNTMKSSFQMEGDRLSFAPVISTRKACTDMKVENYITAFLTTVNSFKVDSNKLFLYGHDKSKYLVFKK